MSASSVRLDTVELPSGPRLRYAASGDPGGAPLVLLHGWPDSWFSYSRVLPLLPPEIFALALDQRGFGESEKPDSNYGVRDFAADVSAFLDALGIARATLVGHSFGSFVARCAAAMAPDRVDGLVLIGTGICAANAVTREVQAALRDLADPVPRDFAREFQAGTIHLPVPDAFFERIVDESLKLPAPLWRLIFDRLLAYDDSAELAKVRAPTLLLWGEQDAIFSRSDQDRFIAARPGTRLTVYTETGHCPNWERPERVALDLDAFVKERRATPTE